MSTTSTTPTTETRRQLKRPHRGVLAVLIVLAGTLVTGFLASPVSATVTKPSNAQIVALATSYADGDKVGDGQCWTFMREIVKTASNGSMTIGGNGDYYSSYTNAGAESISRDAAMPGDIIQVYNNKDHKATGHQHTMIVLGHTAGSDMFSVIDQNWNPLQVSRRTFDVNAWVKKMGDDWSLAIWRVGTVSVNPIAFTRSDGTWYADDRTPWQQLAPYAADDISVAGEWIGIVNSEGGFIKNSASGWVRISAGIRKISVASNGRVMFTRSDGTWLRRDPTSAWEQIAVYVADDIAVSPTRIALVNSEGGFFRDDNGTWQKISAGIRKVALSPNGRIAFTRYDGTWWQANGTWEQLAPYASDEIAVADTRVALINSEGGFVRGDTGTWQRVSAGIMNISVG